MYHSFLIHLSADGHLGCFHVLAIINSAAMNFGVHVTQGFLNPGLLPKGGIKLQHLLWDQAEARLQLNPHHCLNMERNYERMKMGRREQMLEILLRIGWFCNQHGKDLLRTNECSLPGLLQLQSS